MAALGGPLQLLDFITPGRKGRERPECGDRCYDGWSLRRLRRCDSRHISGKRCMPLPLAERGHCAGSCMFAGACHREPLVAHSCWNRHCPQCQGKLATEWLEEQERRCFPSRIFTLRSGLIVASLSFTETQHIRPIAADSANGCVWQCANRPEERRSRE